MARYLLFRLYGPMASWGEIAVGEDRHTAYSPSRSALIGFLGAALGVPRDDSAAQEALSAQFRFAVRQELSGSFLRDFHTIQVGVPERKQVFRTRRHELSGRVNTMLSSRTYVCDSLQVVAVQTTSDTDDGVLEGMKEALLQPTFALYLGRKSCPLAIPVSPKIVEAPNLLEAFESHPFPSLLALTERRPNEQAWPSGHDKRCFRLEDVRYFWEEGMESGMKASLERWRTDLPLSRTRWQFGRRREMVAFANRGEA